MPIRLLARQPRRSKAKKAILALNYPAGPDFCLISRIRLNHRHIEKGRSGNHGFDRAYIVPYSGKLSLQFLRECKRLFVYAGIDEAGYGPMFGPLVVARSIFVLDRHDPVLEPPSLWTLLRSSVCKKPADKKKRLAVNDSKLLYKPAWSLKHIERGVLSFLSTSGVSAKNLNGLLENLAYDSLSREIKLDWYLSPGGEPRIPLFLSPTQLQQSKERLNKAMFSNAVRLGDIKAALVFEDRFNQMVRSNRSKAACAWTFVSGHLKSVWRQYGHHHPLAVVDRQGGRRNYKDLLASDFFPAELEILYENPQKSGYRLIHGTRQMHVLIQVGSEKQHLPVALASMAAKYLRELLMMRFQDFWSVQAPEVKPTYGYFGDGRRFLKEIRPLIDELKIDPEKLIRCC